MVVRGLRSFGGLPARREPLIPAERRIKMISYNVEGKPILTCSCGSQWWVSGTNRCWECGREASPAEIEEYEEACQDGRKE